MDSTGVSSALMSNAGYLVGVVVGKGFPCSMSMRVPRVASISNIIYLYSLKSRCVAMVRKVSESSQRYAVENSRSLREYNGLSERYCLIYFWL